jgi:hypothetical protein
MKVRLGDLRQIICEEFMRGVPEFMVRQATDDCTDRIRQHVKRFIQLRAENPSQARELMQIANKTLAELDEKMYAVAEDALWQFIQQT